MEKAMNALRNGVKMCGMFVVLVYLSMNRLQSTKKHKISDYSVVYD